MFVEERDEFNREAYGLGEYRKGDSEKATGSTASWALSAPTARRPLIGAADSWPESGPAVMPAHERARYQVVASTAAGDPSYEYLVIRYPAGRSIPHVCARFASLEDADVFVKAREAADAIPAPF